MTTTCGLHVGMKLLVLINHAIENAPEKIKKL